MIAAISGCSEKITERRTIAFSEGTIELVRTSVGSALGEERVELNFDNAGEVRTFFQGSNFSEFDVEERDDKIHIQMCGGSIQSAEPIGVGDPLGDFKVKRLNIDWNCKGEMQNHE